MPGFIALCAEEGREISSAARGAKNSRRETAMIARNAYRHCAMRPLADHASAIAGKQQAVGLPTKCRLCLVLCADCRDTFPAAP
jgi:hypothetical protein